MNAQAGEKDVGVGESRSMVADYLGARVRAAKKKQIPRCARDDNGGRRGEEHSESVERLKVGRFEGYRKKGRKSPGD